MMLDFWFKVPKTSTAFDVISMALHKSRRDETERPENFVLIEETDAAGTSGGTGSGGGGKGSSTKRQRRTLDAKENVYLVTLSWKGAGRLVLEEKQRGNASSVSSSASTLHPNVFENALHANVCETMSEPVGRLSPVTVTSKMSPNLRRHSRNIVSNVRKFSRSFYGGSTTSSSASSGLTTVTSSISVESNVTKIAVSTGPSSDSEIPTLSVDIDIDSDQPVRPEVTSSSSQPSLSPTMSRSGSARKMSKINLKKLKIW